jgi:hypothetical protein
MTDAQAVLAKSMKERDLQESVISTARALGWLVFHAYDSRRSTGSGFPDLVLARKSALMFVELKSERGRLSAAQERWIDTLVGGDALVCLWRPSDLLSGGIERALRSVSG